MGNPKWCPWNDDAMMRHCSTMPASTSGLPDIVLNVTASQFTTHVLLPILNEMAHLPPAPPLGKARLLNQVSDNPETMPHFPSATAGKATKLFTLTERAAKYFYVRRKNGGDVYKWASTRNGSVKKEHSSISSTCRCQACNDPILYTGSNPLFEGKIPSLFARLLLPGMLAFAGSMAPMFRCSQQDN